MTALSSSLVPKIPREAFSSEAFNCNRSRQERALSPPPLPSRKMHPRTASRWRTGDTTEPLERITGIGSHGHTLRLGDLCTVRRGGGRFGAEGSAGRLREIDGVLECVADGVEVSAPKQPQPRRQETYDPAVGATRPHGAGDKATKDASYAEYDASLREAWRRAR